jgi:hypothetical protein
MKAQLIFDLPEEEEAFRSAVNGQKITTDLPDFYNKSLRARLKYSELSTEQHELVEQIRNEFVELFGDWI